MSPEQAAAVAKIREALAAGPTDGPWSVLDGNRVGVSLASQHAECGFSSHCIALTHGAPRLNPEVNAAYIAACDPATIRAILAALDAAQAPREVPRLTDDAISDAVRDADLDWHHGWTLDETAPNRFTQFARAVESRVRELCGVAPTPNSMFGDERPSITVESWPKL